MARDTRIRRNLVSSLVYQIVLIALSFLLPRLYLENFGSEVNGVLSTIKQIFAYMLLLEAGVGLATTQALYKRIGEKDYKSVSEVLSATNIYYKRTGIIYLALVLFISLVFGVWALIDKIIGRALEGMTTVIIITIFIGSIIMISLGIIGYYIARIYEEIKGRPKYIISATTKSKNQILY